MGTINYNSDLFVNGETVDTEKELVGFKKIKLKDVPVSGNIMIPETVTEPAELTWEGDVPDTSGISTQTNFEKIGFVVDQAVPQEIVSQVESGMVTYYAQFGVYAQGNITIGEKEYMAGSHDTVKVKLLIGDLKEPDFTGAVVKPYFTNATSAYITADTKKPFYKFGVKAFTVPASGKADIAVALVTPK